MSAQSIHGDNWHGMLNDEWQVDRPSWDEVDKAVKRLDAKTYTIVTVQGPNEQHLVVGGGAGRYVVYATFDNCEFWNLLAAGNKDGVVLLTAGGQEGDYPADQIVDLQQACAAARTFLADLKLEPTLRWQKQ